MTLKLITITAISLALWHCSTTTPGIQSKGLPDNEEDRLIRMNKLGQLTP